MPASSSRKFEIHKYRGDQREHFRDDLAVEEPLEIQILAANAANAAARSVSITMRTPGHDVELALGFLYTEAILSGKEQIASVAGSGPVDAETGLQNIVRVELEAGVEIDLSRLERHFYTTSSCGVCGKTSIDALRVNGRGSLKDKGATFGRKLIRDLPDKLLQNQELFTRTGGLHAAAVFDRAGEIVVVREDVGRHNAVDKVVGALLLTDRLPANELGLLVSGRASFELMQKALVAGLPTLVAVGAPSSLAVDLGREYGMTLVGFLRGERFNIYAGDHRIT